MKKRYLMAIVAATLITLGMVSICSVQSAFAAEKTRLSIVTAGTTGVFYIYG